MSQGCGRFENLKMGLSQALLDATTSMKFEDFQAVFEDFDKAEQISLYDMYRQVLHQICANTDAEFGDMAAEAMLSSKLDTLEELERESKLEQGLWRLPKVSPTEAARSCRVQAKRQEMARLQTLLAESEAECKTAEGGRLEQQKLKEEAARAYSTMDESLQQVHSLSKAWAYRETASC